MDLGRRQAPVDARLRLVDLPGVGHALVRLRRQGQRAGFEPLPAPRPSAARRAASADRAARRPSRTAPMATRSVSADRSGVEAFIHLHDHHAGLLVARHDRPLDRRGAAPARQERGVAVVGAEPRAVEDRLSAAAARRRRPRRHRPAAPRTPPARPRPFSDTGDRTSMPSLSASRCTGDGVSSSPRRPAGRGGCV